MKKITFIFLTLLAIQASNVPASETQEDEQVHSSHKDDGKEHKHGEDSHEKDEHKHNEDSHGEEEHEAKETSLTSEQIQLAGIKISTLVPKSLNYQVYAPGEIKANGYTSYLVSPRVDSVVLKRHASLGDHIAVGQPLVTLFSESVAEAQAQYQIANGEWLRVKRLGRKAVGDKRFLSAQSENSAALARLKAYGLSSNAIEQLQKSKNVFGEYTLSADVNGVVLTDDFHQGQRVNAGEALMIVADEKELWVEARLPANSKLALPKGTIAVVQTSADRFEATVSQEAHTIEPTTRTRIVRLTIQNNAHRLHSGLFVNVFFKFKTDSEVIAVPETALMRNSDGDWVVFIEKSPGQFEPHEITLGRPLGKLREVFGVDARTKVVTEGAFFVASQLAKGGFDPHNH
ncbi:efflux RND transporter periplasmic adaptor subunit [Aliikangiella marina]|uniref:Efflux RND transporter periplasmic adaptor subunit n=1 Tax=Aliikangiella marina TaxID=1712262 RepID=A0A545TJI9_9GAMM|nr:efflux RND transporter periplasmic adaptor subunit [Aliikangiella marina]TQV77331.1 efflux RND transporter periplasmic adaptor subunit [Aliikangiella marina]